MFKRYYVVKDVFIDYLNCISEEHNYIGQQCLIHADENLILKGEVSKIIDKRVSIRMLQKGDVRSGAKVEFLDSKFYFPLDENEIIGKVVNCYGDSMYGENYNFDESSICRIDAEINALDLAERRPITEILPTKIKIIDALYTIGEGQRLGLFAPAGAGKTTTVSIMANNVEADVIIFAMIGERAREVVEFMEGELGPDVIQKSITIVSTSDALPLEKVRSGIVAVSLAQHYMKKGKKVALFFDSLTRYARAQSMLDNTPITSSIPLGVSLSLARLVEGCGNSVAGSITAIYTVLIENDIDEDPIAHEIKSLIDGHLVYSTSIAASGRYPAIDILRSKSRLQNKILDKNLVKISEEIKNMVERYHNVELLIKVGEYERGNDCDTDRAIDLYPNIIEYLKQGFEGVEFENTIEGLKGFSSNPRNIQNQA